MSAFRVSPDCVDAGAELDAQLKGAGDKMVVIDFHATCESSPRPLAGVPPNRHSHLFLLPSPYPSQTK